MTSSTDPSSTGWLALTEMEVTRNTAGSVFGALLGGYALFFWLDLHHVYRIALVAIAAAAALATAR